MYKKLPLIASLFLLTTMGVGCVQENNQNTDRSAIEARTQNEGPWSGSLNIATSKDGLTFTRQEVLLSRAGVPNLLKTSDGTLILTFQYFSETDLDAFDVIAYMTSTDEGETWSEMKTVTFSDLPTGSSEEKKPMDPTLVETSDGTLRLYFTYHAKGSKNATLFSADSKSINDTFKVNDQALAVSNRGLLDPAVVFFNGAWQHYTWEDDSENNIHSTSNDGLTFTRQEDISLPMDFLGQVIPAETGLRFYGSGKNGIVSASSTDGETWTMDSGTRVTQGADPGIVKLSDGTYLMIYTSMNFNE